MTSIATEPQTLSDVLKQVREAVTVYFTSTIWLVADINRVTPGKHMYLELAEYDANTQKPLAKAKAVIWSYRRNIIENFRKATGEDLAVHMKVLILVQPIFAPEHGLTLEIHDISPEFSEGLMKVKVTQIIEQLTQKQLIDNQKALRSPFDFHRIALLAPKNAAGLEDFFKILEPVTTTNMLEVSTFHATFEGVTATQTLVDALLQIAKILRDQPEAYDAVVMVRGGGDSTGLKYLNDMAVAEQVCLMPVPVLTGIGHERDTTVIDLVANRALPTPSAVASHIHDTIKGNARIVWTDFRTIKQRLTAKVNEMESHIQHLQLLGKRGHEMATSTHHRRLESFNTQIASALQQKASRGDAVVHELGKGSQLATHAFLNQRIKALEPLWGASFTAMTDCVRRHTKTTTAAFFDICNRLSEWVSHKAPDLFDFQARLQHELLCSTDERYRALSRNRYSLFEIQTQRTTQLRDDLEATQSRIKSAQQTRPLFHHQQIERYRQSLQDRLFENLSYQLDDLSQLQIRLEKAQQKLRTQQHTRKQRRVIVVMALVIATMLALIAVLLWSR
jgi:exodeoxyribonuclease VII large subunit